MTEAQLADVARATARKDATFTHGAFARYVRSVEQADGCAVRADLLRAVMAHLLTSAEPLIEALLYPPAVIALVRREFERIGRQCAEKPDEHFTLASHKLRCDIRILCFARVPVGAQHIEISGVPRSLLWKGGAAQAVRFARILRRLGGTAPVYQTHMSHEVNRINFLRKSGPAARDEVYRNVAGCLEMNPHVRGLLTSSWLNDPHLDESSPHLSFFRRRPLENGAVLLRTRQTRGPRTRAVTVSENGTTGKRLPEYTPEAYSVVWARRDLIAWAKRSGDTETGSSEAAPSRLPHTNRLAAGDPSRPRVNGQE